MKNFNRERFFKDIQHIVNIDSGSFYREGLLDIATWFSNKFQTLEWDIEWFEPVADMGKSFLVSNVPRTSKLDLLILCHIDTVFPQGTAKTRPFSYNKSKMYGPGVADMKTGCLFTLYSIEELCMEGKIKGNVAIFFNAEEEIGSLHTRPIIENLCSKSTVVISPEPARPDGSYVNKRAGAGRYTINFHGKAAHSGNAPHEGESAITEAAHWILFLDSLCDKSQGIHINPGIISGGTSPNIIPYYAQLKLDLRFLEYEDGQMIEEKLRKKCNSPYNKKIRILLEGGITRPPMKPNSKTEKICKFIEKIGDSHSVKIKWTFSGGGSDASFASTYNIPALCGLGAVGGNYHNENEYVVLKDIAQRYRIFRDIVSFLSNNKFT